MTRSGRARSIAGGMFVVAFVASLVLLGEEVGAFGDSDRTFAEHFSTGSQRGADIAGSGLLAAAAAAFMCFTHLIASKHTEAPSRSAGTSLVRIAGMIGGIFMIVAALALLAVPLSISMGEFYDEEGSAFGEAQAVLPQFGYVALVFGAMVPAAVTIVAVARLAVVPRWLRRSSFPIAVLLAVTSGLVITMVLLPVWVALATAALALSDNRQTAD